jgi:hypothetical protein
MFELLCTLHKSLPETLGLLRRVFTSFVVTASNGVCSHSSGFPLQLILSITSRHGLHRKYLSSLAVSLLCSSLLAEPLPSNAQSQSQCHITTDNQSAKSVLVSSAHLGPATNSSFSSLTRGQVCNSNAVVYLLIPLSLPSKGSIGHNIYIYIYMYIYIYTQISRLPWPPVFTHKR